MSEGSRFETLFNLLTLREGGSLEDVSEKSLERGGSGGRWGEGGATPPLSARAWQLLEMLPTNREMRAGLASLGGFFPGKGGGFPGALPAGREPTPQWSQLLHDGGSSFKLLYSLQIVDSLIGGEQDTASSPVSPSSPRAAEGSKAEGGGRIL